MGEDVTGASTESNRRQIRFDPQTVARYLGLLGIRAGPPSLRGLKELVAAHLARVPFENVSKLLYKKRIGLADIPPIRMYLDGIEKCHFGGTCYSNNYYFYCLLESLGYDIRLCSADMAIPDIHAVSMACVEGHEYLVDTGYAAPFLAPLPRDLETDHVVALGRDRYVLRPQDANRCSRLELHRNNILKHGYLAKPAAREIGDFKKAISESFRPDATFLNSFLLARFYPGRSVAIHNLTLIESCGNSCSTRLLAGLDKAAAAIHQYFGIPEALVAEAISDLKTMQDAWGDPFLGGRDRQFL